MHIIIVDDNPIHIEIIEKWLKNVPCTRKTFTNSLEALRYINSNNHIDMAILDKIMKNINGLKIIETIRQNSSLKKIPIILQTADTQDGQYSKALKKGADFYLTKPFDQTQFNTILKAAIRIHNRNNK